MTCLSAPPKDRDERFEVRWKRAEDAHGDYRVLHRVDKPAEALRLRDDWSKSPHVSECWVWDRTHRRIFALAKW